MMTLITWFTCPPTIYFKFITKCDKCYYKVRQLFLLQSAMVCYHKVRQLFYYKVRQVLLQSATDITKCDNFITKCDDYYKVRQYNTYYIWAACGTASRSLHFMPPRTRDVCGAVPLLLLSLFAPDNDLISP